MNFITTIKVSFFTGTIASLAMMPAGLFFKFIGVRVGHYGPKLGALLFGEPTQLILFVQHLVIGWVSALPLVIFLTKTKFNDKPVLCGSIYGALYYVLINSLSLPIFFADKTPWELGFSYIYPSLIIHLIFGAAIGYSLRYFVQKD